MLCVRELCLLTAWWISNNLISKKHLRENDLIGYNYIISYIWVNVPLCTDLVYLYISQVHGWTPCSSSQSADKSLLFHLLPLAFRTHSHCLPAMTTPICEMRAQKTEDFFFLSGLNAQCILFRASGPWDSGCDISRPWPTLPWPAWTAASGQKYLARKWDKETGFTIQIYQNFPKSWNQTIPIIG